MSLARRALDRYQLASYEVCFFQFDMIHQFVALPLRGHRPPNEAETDDARANMIQYAHRALAKKRAFLARIRVLLRGVAVCRQLMQHLSERLRATAAHRKRVAFVDWIAARFTLRRTPDVDPPGLPGRLHVCQELRARHDWKLVEPT